MMTPTTFDMPDAIDEPVDAQDTELEQASELGHVEGAEPGQDWNDQGVFIGAAEIIEVPFRRTVKSKAMVRVVLDGEQHLWRSGWHWKSLLRNDSDKMNEVGKELSREFIGYASKAEAVNDALTDMASHAAPFDKRIGDDILKFRDTDWYVADSGDADSDGEPADDEPIKAQQTDPETKAAIDELSIAGVSVGEPAAAANGRPAKTPPTEAELQAKAERAFKAKMREATDHLADCVLARIEAEATYKTAKAEEKAAAETLRAIADRGPERLPIVEYAERNAAAAATQSAEPEKPAAPVASDAWKSASVTELGLPKGVESKLTGDGIDTIGRLEQRRADISHKREKWPAGIGKAAVDKIENAVLAWLAKNQHADQATEAKPVAAEPVDVPTEASAAAEATSDREIDPEIGDVTARLDELLGDPEFMSNPEDKLASLSYGSGREAYERGDLLTDCPLIPGDEQDRWLMGWADAKEADRELE